MNSTSASDSRPRDGSQASARPVTTRRQAWKPRSTEPYPQESVEILDAGDSDRTHRFGSMLFKIAAYYAFLMIFWEITFCIFVPGIIVLNVVYHLLAPDNAPLFSPWLTCGEGLLMAVSLVVAFKPSLWIWHWFGRFIRQLVSKWSAPAPEISNHVLWDRDLDHEF